MLFYIPDAFLLHPVVFVVWYWSLALPSTLLEGSAMGYENSFGRNVESESQNFSKS